LVRFNADGSLDTSFGNGGRLITAISVSDPGSQNVVLQPDGKILVAGVVDTVQMPVQAPDGSAYRFTITRTGVVRYNADGSLDQSFGTGGEVIFSFGDPGAVANSVAIQPDGKLVVVGSSTETTQSTSTTQIASFFTVARYNQDGSLDTTFAQGGVSNLNFPGDFLDQEHADGVTIQADGKILVTGSANSYLQEPGFVAISANLLYTTGPVTIQYNPDGTLDASFGVGGILFGPLTPPRGAVSQPASPNGPPAAPPAEPPFSAPKAADAGSAQDSTAPPATVVVSATPSAAAPGATPTDPMILSFLQNTSVVSALPLPGPIQNAPVGVVGGTESPTAVSAPVPTATGDPFATRISGGGGSQIPGDGSTDPFAFPTTQGLAPDAAFDTAGEPTLPPNDGSLAPHAVLDIVFTLMPFADDSFQAAEPRFVLAKSARVASALPSVVATATNAVDTPQSLKLPGSVSLGLFGIGLIGAGVVLRRKKRQPLWLVVTPASRGR